MKTRVLILIGFLLLSYSFTNSKETPKGVNSSAEGSVNVYTSADLYELTMKWSSEYINSHPNLKINVIKAADEKVADMVKKGEGIGFTTEQSVAGTDARIGWNLVVGRDVIVPVMNAANPFIEEINRTGLSRDGLKSLLQNREKPSWGILTGNPKNIQAQKVNLYFMNDPAISNGIARFLNIAQLPPAGSGMDNTQQMISAIQKDQGALGFCRLVQVMNPDGQTLAENIRLVPIDKNENGKIDYMENIYENLQSFSRGVWIGKYPNALVGNIYMLAAQKPQNETERAFLNWVLTEGQQYMNAHGYNDLVISERQSQLDKINEPVKYAAARPDMLMPMIRIILLVMVAFVFIGFIVDFFIRRAARTKEAVQAVLPKVMPVFDENSVIVPQGLYFDKSHTWAFMKKDGHVKIGIDDFMQHVTGQLTGIEMKNAGEKVRKGELLFTIIQQGKQLNIHSPVTGTIVSQNESLLSDASLLNTSPYANGWVYTIEPHNWSLEIQFLTMADKYKYWLRDEFMRLKDFLARASRSHVAELQYVVLQDGGVLNDAVLAGLGPEIWDDFQTKFIDTARI